MASFIVILVAAPVVFWLFRRRPRRNSGGPQPDERHMPDTVEQADVGGVKQTIAAAPLSELGQPSTAETRQSAPTAVLLDPGSASPLVRIIEDTPAVLSSQEVREALGNGNTVHLTGVPSNDQADFTRSSTPGVEDCPTSPANTEPPNSQPVIAGEGDRGFETGANDGIEIPQGIAHPADIGTQPLPEVSVTDEVIIGVADPAHLTEVEGTSNGDTKTGVLIASELEHMTGQCVETGTPEAVAQVCGETWPAESESSAVPGSSQTNTESEHLAEEASIVDTGEQSETAQVPAEDESAAGQAPVLNGDVPAGDFGHDESAGIENVDVPAPARYRPPPQRQARRSSGGAGSATRAPRSDSVLEIRVRMTLDRFGFCQISLLPERKRDMDDEITVKAGALRLTLAAQEDWYGDLYFDDIGERLRQGIRLGGLLSGGRRVQWQLSGGRNIYVLGGHPSASGFVSVPRLALGRPHVVLCANEVLEQAEAILKQAGCHGYAKLDPSHGVPDGWTGLRGVLPETALPLDPGIDPFYALKPAPDIDISLEGGLPFHDAAWIAGYPPQIRVTGQASGALRVLIDGKEAHAADGCYAAAGFDAPGQHLVECEGLSCSRSYSIEEPAESWEQWAAYAFSGADVCGPLVTLRPEAARSRVFTVPMSNPLLLGAEPGQVFRCSHRNVANWQGFVPFEVVWALPAQPLICDKKTSRILCFSSAPMAPANARRPLGWCSAILDAARKGLRVESGSPESTAQWIEYKRAARNIWRGRR